MGDWNDEMVGGVFLLVAGARQFWLVAVGCRCAL